MSSAASLTTAVDDLFTTDLDAIDDDTLHELVVDIARQRDRLALAHARLLARWDARRLWQSDGSRSAAARLTRDTNHFAATARGELRRARRLLHMPATANAARHGHLSLDQVDVLIKANQPWRQRHMATDEAGLVQSCRQLTAAESLRLANYWGQRVDALVGRSPAPRDTANHLHASDTIDGNVVVNGQLDPLGGATFMNELRRLTEQLRHADLQAGIDRSPAHRRAAALVEMATRSASAAPGSRRPQPLFTVQLGDDSFHQLCELAKGTVLNPTELLPWLNEAQLETVLFDGPSTVVSVSHRRSFTGALRRAIEVRDRHCQHPAGCEVPAEQCDVDHIVPFAQGGSTDQFNGRLQCPTHNRRSDLHDHASTPRPRRSVSQIDALRARVRWRIRHGAYTSP
jgi:hypothetical protein